MAKEFIARLAERTTDRDTKVSVSTLPQPAQGDPRWGDRTPQDLGKIDIPTFVANGESDQTAPTSNTVELDRRLPNSEFAIYPDAGHGGIFQYHESS